MCVIMSMMDGTSALARSACDNRKRYHCAYGNTGCIYYIVYVCLVYRRSWALLSIPVQNDALDHEIGVAIV